jgi:hypothetical protein
MKISGARPISCGSSIAGGKSVGIGASSDGLVTGPRGLPPVDTLDIFDADRI